MAVPCCWLYRLIAASLASLPSMVIISGKPLRRIVHSVVVKPSLIAYLVRPAIL
jgi:hypothetical protein